MGIKSRKLKNKTHNIVLIVITAAAFLATIISPLLYAFDEPKIIYAVIWLFASGWCVCFVRANEKRDADVY